MVDEKFKIILEPDAGKNLAAGKAERVLIDLQVRSSANGDLIVFDHKYIDIVLMAKENKIVAFAKDELTDDVYEIQLRFFKHLSAQGLIDMTSIQGGSVFMSMEAKLSMPENGRNIYHMALLSIYKFIEKERPFFEYLDKVEQWEEDRLMDPPEDEVTDWDPEKFNHQVTKGSIRPGLKPYGVPGVYRF